MKRRSDTEMRPGKRLSRNFYIRDVLDVAPELIGKTLVVITGDDIIRRFMITETEAYRGTEDLACHACRGKTPRTGIMFGRGGMLYVYFVYGMYWMLNIVTGEKDNPQAALIRGIEGFSGPGKLTRELSIDRSFYGEDLTISERIWIEDRALKPVFKSGPRIGVNYAGEIWKNKPWRYYIV
jgi:DNA-3-methyladenine glycosylase